ncbi:MAG TPA: hypothetical protein EYH22_01650 [Candidatus Nanopusillus sp.]|nr:hypothetical protein [Candidatus Nanopusillus sp.]
MDNEAILKKLYESLKRFGRLDKDRALSILGLEPTDWNYRKVLHYLKKLSEEYEDVTLEKGPKGKYYVEFVGRGDLPTGGMVFIDVESFEKLFWSKVYGLESRKSDNLFMRYYEVIDISDITKIMNKYKIWEAGEWIKVKLKEYDESNDQAYLEGNFVGYTIRDPFKPFLKEVPWDRVEDLDIPVYRRAAKCPGLGAYRPGKSVYYCIIRGKDKVYMFENATPLKYCPKTGRVLPPDRIIVYDVNKDIDTVLKDLQGTKTECSNLIYVVDDIEKRVLEGEKLVREKLSRIFKSNTSPS